MDQGGKADRCQAGGLSNRTEISVSEPAASRQPLEQPQPQPQRSINTVRKRKAS